MTYEDLTPHQQAAILDAKPDQDYCYRSNPMTRKALASKGLSKPTDGFGYKHGQIQELTDKGKEIREQMLALQRPPLTVLNGNCSCKNSAGNPGSGPAWACAERNKCII